MPVGTKLVVAGGPSPNAARAARRPDRRPRRRAPAARSHRRRHRCPATLVSKCSFTSTWPRGLTLSFMRSKPMPSMFATRPERRKHDVGGQFVPAGERHLDLREAVEARGLDLCPGAITAAHRLEPGEKPRAQRRVEKSQRLRRLVHQGHGAAERREYRCVFAGDDAAAEDDQGSWQIRQAEDRIAVDDVFVVHLDRRDVTRPGAGGEHDAVRMQHARLPSNRCTSTRWASSSAPRPRIRST